MAFQVGQITSAISATTGSANIAGVGIVPTSIDALIPVILGQFVCGDYAGGTLYVLATLDTAWTGTMAQLNALSQISSASIQSSLNAGKCCAVKKGAKMLSDAEGQCCVEDEEEVQTMLNLIDSISCIVPEGEIISGRQAVYVWYIEALNNTTHDVVVTVGGATYAFTTTSSNNKTTIAAEIAAFINTFYPQNYSYQAKSFVGNILVWGNNFDVDNGTAVTATITDGVFVFPLPKQLDFGTAKALQPANAITNNSIQNILNKLCAICKN